MIKNCSGIEKLSRNLFLRICINARPAARQLLVHAVYLIIISCPSLLRRTITPKTTNTRCFVVRRGSLGCFLRIEQQTPTPYPRSHSRRPAWTIFSQTLSVTDDNSTGDHQQCVPLAYSNQAGGQRHCLSFRSRDKTNWLHCAQTPTRKYRFLKVTAGSCRNTNVLTSFNLSRRTMNAPSTITLSP